jgi:hypothetical protein
MSRNESLPDITEKHWKPRIEKAEALKNTMLQTCRSVQQRIIEEAMIEKKFNIDNYDSGSGLEDIIREQFKILLPSRYMITPGVIIDTDGKTCGDCDFIITNGFWLPFIKYGATSKSRRVHIPVEAVYTVIEIKQKITQTSLEEAMQKIVTYKRLSREDTLSNQITENYRVPSHGMDSGELLNYRYDIILGVGCEDKDEISLVKRFFKINELLPAEDCVNALAILGKSYSCYVGEIDGCSEESLYPEIKEVEHKPFYLPTKSDTLFYLYTNLWTHLTRTILNFDNFNRKYGRKSADTQGHILNINE